MERKGSTVALNGGIPLILSRNHNYQIQYTTNLATANWTDVGSAITPTNSSMTISLAIGTNSEQYYRVVLLP
jgi:hypothetical protein